MIRLINEKKSVLYKFKYDKRVKSINFEDFGTLQSICCSKDIFGENESLFLLNLTDTKTFSQFFKTIDSQFLIPIKKSDNLNIILSSLNIKKLIKSFPELFEELILEDAKTIFINYFHDKKITIEEKYLEILLEQYDNDFYGLENEVFLNFLSDKTKVTKKQIDTFNSPIFFHIDQFIINNKNKESFDFFITTIVDSNSFLQFLGLLFNKLELILNLKLLSSQYDLKGISSLLDKNIYYIKNSILISNKVTIQKVYSLLQLVSKIDYLYKIGKITIENAIVRITL